MTRIEELEQSIDETVEKFRLEINKFKAELENIKELAEDSKKDVNGKWKPQLGEDYWFRNDEGTIVYCIYNGYVADTWRYNNIPIFPTEEECEKYWRFMDTVKDKSYEFSDLDWQDDDIVKWVIEYDYLYKQLRVGDHRCIKHFGLIYFKDEESAQYIIDNFKDELMEYWI